MDYQYYPPMACNRAASMTSGWTHFTQYLAFAAEFTGVLRAVHFDGEADGIVVSRTPRFSSIHSPLTTLEMGV